MTLESIGLALLITRLLDAISDPLIGYLSDKYNTRYGKRKPWLFVGAFLCAISTVYFFSPPESADFSYFLVWMILLSLSWTLIGIPFSAWTIELTHNAQERTKLYAVLSIVGSIGAAFFFITPLLPAFEGTEYSAEVLEAMGWGIAFTLPVTMLACLYFVPRGSTPPLSNTISLKEITKTLRHNKVFQRFVLIAILGGIAFGLPGAVLFLYTDTYLGLGEYMPYVLVANFIISPFIVPLWAKLMNRFEKHKIWALCILGGTTSLLPLFFVEPGESAIYFLFVFTIIGTAFEAGTGIASASIFADVIDYDLVKTGVQKAANLGAVLGLISKVNIAIGASLGFFLIGFFGYDIKGENDALAVFGLKFTFLVLPFIFTAGSFLLAWKFPITKCRQESIRRILEKLSLRKLS